MPQEVREGKRCQDARLEYSTRSGVGSQYVGLHVRFSMSETENAEWLTVTERSIGKVLVLRSQYTDSLFDER